MIKNIFLLCVTLNVCSVLLSQSLSSNVISSGGGLSSATAGSLSYTIGEVSTLTFKTLNSVLTQGFQQGTGSGSGSSIVQLISEMVNVQLFPNPASKWVEFSITAPSNTKVGITIYDILGNKVCDVMEIRNQGFDFRAVQGVSNLADGVYFAIVSVADNSNGSNQYISKRFIVNN